MNITLRNENGTSHFLDFPVFFLFISIFIIYAFILYNVTKFCVNAGFKKNSILIEESYLLITVISWKN